MSEDIGILVTNPVPDRPQRRPYPGLRPFQRDEGDLFFGRDEQVDQLLDKLAETRFLAVVGTSGSGKSSLVRAGLLPALDSGVLTRPPGADGAVPGTRWAIAEIRPGDQPFQRLAAALGSVGTLPARGQDAPAPMEQALRSGSRAIPWLLGLHPLPPGERLLILVDQFEELFRYRRENPAAAAAFVALLLGATAHRDCHVVITLRSEYLGDCSRFPDLPEAINAGLFLTPRLTPEQLADAIQLPARLPEFGGDLSPALVRRLLAESAGEQDQLPLLQHVLMRLWDRTAPDAEGRRLLDEPQLAALGGLRAALDGHAEEAYAELDPDRQQPIAETLFRALTERADGERDIRRPVAVAEIARLAGVDPAAVIACAEPFRRADRSFLMPAPDQPLGPDGLLDITHEALIRQWHRLQRWTADESERAELYQRLESAARRWHAGKGALWIDPDLSSALAWRDQFNPSVLWAARYGGDFALAMQFLEAGRDARDRQQLLEEARRQHEVRRARRIAAASVAALLVTLALCGWGYVERHRAEIAETEAQHQAATAVAEKQARTRDLFASKLTHASLLAKGEDYAAAWKVLGETLALDADGIPAGRRHVRNLLAGMVDLRRETSDLEYRGADAALTDLALSPNGRWLVAGGERGTLVIFDAVTGTLVRRLEGHDPAAGDFGSVKAVRFTANGDRLYSGGTDARIIAWSVPDWQRLDQWQAPDEVFSLALSPDGKRLASAGHDNGITLWSTATGKKVRTLTGETSLTADGSALAWLPDGRLISGGFNGQVGIWDSKTGTEQVLPRVHTDQVNGVAVSPDGKRFATGGSDRLIILWDTATSRPLRALSGHKNKVLGLAFDPSGQRLLSASYDNDLRLWDLDSGSTLRVYQGHTAGLWCVVAANGSAYTAANDGTLRRWPLGRSGQWIWDLPGAEPAATAIDPEAGLVLLGLADGALRAYWLPGAGTAPAAADPLPGTQGNAADRPVGPLTQAAADQPSGAPDPYRQGPLLAEVAYAHITDVNRIALSPDRRTIATAGADGQARLWRPERTADGLSLTPLHRLAGHTDAVYAVAFSPDGQWVATGGYDGQVGIFEVASGTGALSPAHGQCQPAGCVEAVQFSRDGNELMSVGYGDLTIRLWQRDGAHIADGRTIARLSDSPLWAALSPDGREVAAVGRNWVVTRHPLAPPADTPDGSAGPEPLVGHEQTVYRAIYTPDGQALATVGGDMTVRLWDLDSSQSLFRLQLPDLIQNRGPWDFDLSCTADGRTCWIAVPLTMGRLALYRLPYADPPPGLAP